MDSKRGLSRSAMISRQQMFHSLNCPSIIIMPHFSEEIYTVRIDEHGCSGGYIDPIVLFKRGFNKSELKVGEALAGYEIFFMRSGTTVFLVSMGLGT